MSDCCWQGKKVSTANSQVTTIFAEVCLSTIVKPTCILLCQQKTRFLNLEIQNSISIIEYGFGKTLSFLLFINKWMATETRNTFKLKSLLRNLIPNNRGVIKRWGPGISPSYYEHGPWLLSKENKRKIDPTETPSCLIPCLLVVFTWQLEILVTILQLAKHIRYRLIKEKHVCRNSHI